MQDGTLAVIALYAILFLIPFGIVKELFAIIDYQRERKDETEE